MFAEVFRKEAENEETVFLQKRIFAPVAAISFGTFEMLRAIQLDYEAGLPATEIDLHPAESGKGNR